MARARGRLILGINCAYHESAAALVRDGEVDLRGRGGAAHPNQAREDGSGHRTPTSCPGMPSELASKPCPGPTLCGPGRHRLFARTGPAARLDRRRPVRASTTTSASAARAGRRGIQPARARRFRTSWPAPPAMNRSSERFHFVPHHRAHAASAFYASPFPHAAILVVDGIGETSTAWLGRGTPDGLEEHRGNRLPALDRDALGARGRLSRLHGVRRLQGHGPGRVWRPTALSLANSIASSALWIATEDRADRMGRRS